VQFQGLYEPETFNKIITQDFRSVDEMCPIKIKQGFEEIIKVSKTSKGLELLSKKFLLCSPLEKTEEVYNLYWLLVDAIAYMAMLDYPYPTDFLIDLPAWPVKVGCKKNACHRGFIGWTKKFGWCFLQYFWIVEMF